MSETAYDVRIHKQAERELAAVTGDVGEALISYIRAAAESREPAHQPKVEQLEDCDLYRLRVDGYRAILHQHERYLFVVKVGKRDTVYDDLETAKRRAGL